MILISMGFVLHFYVDREKVYNNFVDKKNSPIQFINQIKGYFYINPYIAISFAITLFSFVGVPPIVGFFAKQMILSAALDSGYVFMSLVAILTSVIGAGYYLNLIKQIFFEKTNYQIHPDIGPRDERAILVSIMANNSKIQTNQKILSVSNPEKEITINSSLSTSISVLSLLLALFIFIPGE
jgi:NADH-ubiquinone oxidoreductase chain 2